MFFSEFEDLTLRNSLRLQSRARWYCEVGTLDELKQALAHAQRQALPALVMGEGTNLVLGDEIPAVVIGLRLKGLAVADDRVTVAAGENWHRLVEHTLEQGLFGLENLALIPGAAGAAPVQNIGAYGIELSDRITDVSALHVPSGEHRTLSAAECGFSYRNSLFRGNSDWIITGLTLQLSRDQDPCVTYPDLQRYLAARDQQVDARAVFNAVVAIRRSKLPDPSVLPNAGSFFKNPVVSESEAEALRTRLPDMPWHATGNGDIKLSAAWLIDRAGLKGRRRGGFQVSEQHALVLVNRDEGSAADLRELVAEIRRQIADDYGVDLEIEPVVYPA